MSPVKLCISGLRQIAVSWATCFNVKVKSILPAVRIMNFCVILRKKSIILSNSINPFILVIDTECVLFEEKVFVIGTYYVFFEVRTLSANT
jgi:hypothetical protein